jgi:hypothetical protein
MATTAFTSSAPDKTTPVANPTWYGDVRYMFTDDDVSHMGAQGLDLTTYDSVVANASSIYGQVSAGNMPPKSPWSDAWTQTFLNWIIANFPKGTDTAGKASVASLAAAQAASRIRKDINDLTQPELATLRQAFSGIIAKAPTDPNSYFVQAGIHYWPAHPALYCQHHVPAYNPWHRPFLLGFENALRSIPGCEQVTSALLGYHDALSERPEERAVRLIHASPGYWTGCQRRIRHPTIFV